MAAGLAIFSVASTPGCHCDVPVIKTDKHVVANSQFNNKSNCFKRFWDYLYCCYKRKNPCSDEQLKLDENDIEMALVAKDKNAEILEQDSNKYQSLKILFAARLILKSLEKIYLSNFFIYNFMPYNRFL